MLTCYLRDREINKTIQPARHSRQTQETDNRHAEAQATLGNKQQLQVTRQ